MPTKSHKIDRFFLVSVLALTGFGFVIFLSASLGLLTQENVTFMGLAMNQTVSLIIGLIAFFVFSRVEYTWIRRSAFFIFLGAIIVNLLLFVPGLSVFHGGASRWINLGFVTFQPSEFLKIAFIIYMAAWAYYAKDKISQLRYGLLPYMVMMGILTVLLLVQSDTDTLVVIGASGLTMLIVAGVPIRHISLAILVMAIGLSGVIFFRPYAYERVKTFFNKGSDTQGSGYQINQSLIAIGSGELTGRGFGQSIQKFGYLPQPTDDSIFAVAAEEFGFFGSIGLILLYVAIAISSFRIGTRSTDIFGGLVAVGIAVLIISESFMNMAAMLGLIPLSGMPLLFVSHGGTALIIILAATGIVANISKHTKGV